MIIIPYIKGNDIREMLDDLVYKFIGRSFQDFRGNLNYFLFKLAKHQCKCYADYAAFIGELEAAKLEIYRRQTAPYEDKKIISNGDVE